LEHGHVQNSAIYGVHEAHDIRRYPGHFELAYIDSL
jgi:hypothetical protein